MAKAMWKGEVIAESDTFEVVEGNVYFPAQSVVAERVRPSAHVSHCPWKGQASYVDVVVHGEVLENAGWTYPTPRPAAAQIAGHVAFWRGVEVTR